MRRSQIVFALAAWFPTVCRALLRFSLRGWVPLSIYDRPICQELERRLWPSGRPWVGRTARLINGMAIEVDPGEYVCREILTASCFERATVAFVQAFLKPGMTFVDAGAHVGQYSLLASALVGPKGSVHAFEPYATLFSVLQRNVRRNRCLNVTLNNTALTTDDGMHDLFIGYARNLGATSFTPSRRQYSGVSLRVPTTSLDRYVYSRHLSSVDLIKIDVEGAELDVIRGAESVIRGNDQVALIVEFCEAVAVRFGRTTAELADYLRRLDFELFRIGDEGLTPYRSTEHDPVFLNVLCVRNAHRNRIPGLR